MINLLVKSLKTLTLHNLSSFALLEYELFLSYKSSKNTVSTDLRKIVRTFLKF